MESTPIVSSLKLEALPPDLEADLSKRHQANPHTAGTSVSLLEALTLARIVWTLKPARTLEVAADGISVNAVAANFIQTETYYPKAVLEDPVKGPKLLSRVPMGRLGEAEEVAALVELLALGRSGFVSGQVIPISGAWC